MNDSEETDRKIERFYDLHKRVAQLEDAIRKHRDERGDDRCWRDDEELYRVLPEGYEPPARDCAVELENCKKYIESRSRTDVEYHSPQRVIRELQDVVTSLSARVAAQSELLSRKSEKRDRKLTFVRHFIHNAVYLDDELIYYGDTQGWQILTALGYKCERRADVNEHCIPIEFDKNSNGTWDPPKSLRDLDGRWRRCRERQRLERIAHLEKELERLRREQSSEEETSVGGES